MIKNCFNYIGSKDRILPIIQENIDTSKRNLVDLFCGSGVVGVNLLGSFDRVIFNDKCWQLIETLQYFTNTPFNKLIYEIDLIIRKYNLSKEGKEGFLKLKEYYNSDPYLQLVFEPVVFYCLIMHSFNYMIHLTKEGKLSSASGAGRSYFSKNLRAKLEAFQWELESNKDKIRFKNMDFSDLIKAAGKAIPNTTFYVDPPYLSSDSSYNRITALGKWNEEREIELYKGLDLIDTLGGTFLLSNVVENNGKENLILKEWMKKYKVIDVNVTYTNCNYQREKNGETREVLVRNY